MSDALGTNAATTAVVVSERDFLRICGLNLAVEADRRVLSIMQAEAQEGLRRLRCRTPTNAFATQQLSLGQMRESLVRDEIQQVCVRASLLSRQVYDLAGEVDIGENWIVRWLLWWNSISAVDVGLNNHG